MPLRDDLLTPIPGDSPAGVSLRYDPLFDRVKEARREDDDLPSGELPAGPRKLADHALVQRLAGEAIATRSKDLQLAAWLTEAQLRREGYAGLAGGLGLLRDLIDQFWDTLHPELEDGDAELRAAPLDWVGGRLVFAARSVPLTKSGLTHLKFEESRDVGYEAATQGSDDKAQRRQEKLTEGKIAAEDWDRAVEGTDVAFYDRLVGELDAALEALAALDELSQARFGDVAPGYSPLRETLEQVRLVAQAILTRKRPPEPELTGEAEGADGDEGEGAAGNGAAHGAGGFGGARRRASGGPSLVELANVEVRAGRPARAVDMLMSAAARGRSRRDRFIRRTAVARIMVEAGLYPVAVPLLEQLLAEIDEFKLEEWEAGDVVATPMALLWRAYDRTGNDREKEPLYLRICRLDPVQAIALTPQDG